MIKVYSIFERIGLGGGGKVKAVFRRLNFLAQLGEFEPVLLNMSHSTSQREIFEILKEREVINPKVTYKTIFDLGADGMKEKPPGSFIPLPAVDRRECLTGRTVYYKSEQPAYEGRTKKVGPIRMTTTNILSKADGIKTLFWINGVIHQIREALPDGRAVLRDYSNGILVSTRLMDGHQFI